MREMNTFSFHALVILQHIHTRSCYNVQYRAYFGGLESSAGAWQSQGGYQRISWKQVLVLQCCTVEREHQSSSFFFLCSFLFISIRRCMGERERGMVMLLVNGFGALLPCIRTVPEH